MPWLQSSLAPVEEILAFLGAFMKFQETTFLYCFFNALAK